MPYYVVLAGRNSGLLFLSSTYNILCSTFEDITEALPSSYRLDYPKIELVLKKSACPRPEQLTG